MKALDLIGSAVANTFRSKTRTILTILAIFIGSFTLTLTSGLGTGINAYIDDTVSGVGASDAMTVTKKADDAGDALSGGSAPQEYDPDAVSAGIPGMTVSALSPDDIDAIAAIEGVVSVDAQRTITPDFVVAGDGTKYEASVGSLIPGQSVVLAAGTEPDQDAAEHEVTLPVAYLEPLGLGSAQDAIGTPVTLGITDAERTQHTLDATVVGVAEDALASPLGSSLLINSSLSDALFEAQSIGLAADQADKFATATVWFDPQASEDEITALQDRLDSAGFTGVTIADRLGMITTVIDGIVLVLNAFAIIALLAAAFGIVNTLYMSVQERTREIGLMKAMGMGSGRVFSLFSLEAAFLGFLGSAIGVGVAMLVGSVISAILSEGLLADLPGLTLIAFNASSIVSTIALVVAIAFVSGTFPAARAARADPVNSLRYE